MASPTVRVLEEKRGARVGPQPQPTAVRPSRALAPPVSRAPPYKAVEAEVWAETKALAEVKLEGLHFFLDAGC